MRRIAIVCMMKAGIGPLSILSASKGQFPTCRLGQHPDGEQEREITVWCGNDYLGMGQHPVVLECDARGSWMPRARVRAGRAISRGQLCIISSLEAELSDLHGKEAALAVSQALISRMTRR